MGKYSLRLKSGEIIHIVTAESFDEAVEQFCFSKKFNKDTLLNLFDVVKEN